MRRTIEETKVNLAYRWFVGLSVEESVPHFSDFSKNYTRKFSHDRMAIEGDSPVREKTCVVLSLRKVGRDTRNPV